MKSSRCTETMKHPDCEDCCQLREHKGYISCRLTGECAWLEALRPTVSAYDMSGLKEYPGE